MLSLVRALAARPQIPPLRNLRPSSPLCAHTGRGGFKCSSGLLSSLLVYPVMALATFLAGCLIGALAATFLTHAEQHSLGSDSIPLSLSDAFAQIQSGWTRPTQVPSVCSVHT